MNLERKELIGLILLALLVAAFLVYKYRKKYDDKKPPLKKPIQTQQRSEPVKDHPNEDISMTVSNSVYAIGDTPSFAIQYSGGVPVQTGSMIGGNYL